MELQAEKKSGTPFIVLTIAGTLLAVVYPINSGLALILGFFVAVFQAEAAPVQLVQKLSKLLLAWAIVGYGLTIKVSSIVALTTQYFWLTASGIALALTGAWILGKYLKIDLLLAALIGSGTAICGASAIAAVGSATKATPEKLSMALGTVLILNAVALIVFPSIGHVLALSSHDFAVWAGLAIHDTSSVIGAAMSYDVNSIDTATTVKLARAIWIAPVTALFAKVFVKEQTKRSFKLPWFIWGYLIAAGVGTLLNLPAEYGHVLSDMARSCFRIGIFLTGAAVSVRALRSLGLRPFLLGVVIWFISAVWSLLLIRT